MDLMDYVDLTVRIHIDLTWIWNRPELLENGIMDWTLDDNSRSIRGPTDCIIYLYSKNTMKISVHEIAVYFALPNYEAFLDRQKITKTFEHFLVYLQKD